MSDGESRSISQRAFAAAVMLTNVVLSTSLGCASLPATQRGLLAEPEMTPSSDALETQFQGHLETAREGASGGHGGIGGGCGCG